MIIIYDIQGFPTEADIDLDKFNYIRKEHGLIFWDSAQYIDNPIEPKVLFAPEEEVIDIKIVDISDEKNAEMLNKILNK